MFRDMINCLMVGGLLSFLEIWEVNTIEQIVIAIGLSVLTYILISSLRKEEDDVPERDQRII